MPHGVSWGLGPPLPFQGLSLVAESLGQGKALYPGLDLRISLKAHTGSEQRQSRHIVLRMGRGAGRRRTVVGIVGEAVAFVALGSALWDCVTPSHLQHICIQHFCCLPRPVLTVLLTSSHLILPVSSGCSHIIYLLLYGEDDIIGLDLKLAKSSG